MTLKEDPMCLEESKDTAFKNLNSLWNCFLKELKYFTLHREFLCKYKRLGHRNFGV